MSRNRNTDLDQSSDISSLTSSSRISQSLDQYNQQFDSYSETKKLESVSYKDDFESESHLSSFAKVKINNLKNNEEHHYGESIGESVSKTEYQDSRVMKGGKKLETIKEETKNKVKNGNQERTNQKQDNIQKQKEKEKEKQKQRIKQKPILAQKTKLKITMHSDQKHLPYNFNRLKQLQKQRVLTDLMQQNGIHKQSIRSLQQQLKKQRIKYAKLLEEKVSQGDDSKQKALLKQNDALKTRLQSLLQFKRNHDQNNTFKALSTPQQKPTSFQEEKIKQELISVIDKLKKRLKQSEEQLKILQKKLEFNQQLDLHESLSTKARQLEKLQYKLAQLSQQAETDRLFIDQLKQKSSKTQALLKQERDKYAKLTKQFRGIQLKISTNNDLVKELAETRKQRDALQKSLRQLSASLITKVQAKNTEQRKELDALGYIDVMDF